MPILTFFIPERQRLGNIDVPLSILKRIPYFENHLHFKSNRLEPIHLPFQITADEIRFFFRLFRICDHLPPKDHLNPYGMASFESCAFSSRYYVEIGEKNISEEEAKAVYAHNRFFTSTVVNGKRTYTDINQYQSGWILTYYMFFEDACEPTLAVMQFADFLGLNIDDRAMKSLHDRIKVDFTKFTYTQLVSFPEFIQLSLINGYIGLFQSNSFNMAFKQFLEDAPSMARLVWESTNRSELLDAISTPVKRRNALVKLPFEDLQPYLRRDMGVKEQDPVLVDLLERIERARHPKELPRYINTERIAMLEHAFSERKKELQRGK